jgi:predicted phosphoribosyltransferase
MHGDFLTADRFDYASERATLHVAAPVVTECRAPVATRRSARPAAWCDEIVALATPHDIYGVRAFYGDFRGVTDEDVVRLIEAPPVSAPE